MRKTLFFAILCIVIVALTPWIDGVFLKKSYFTFIDVLNHEARAKVAIIEYHSGWFHSTAKVRITIPSQSKIASEQNIILDQQLNHGPVLFGAYQRMPVIALAEIVTTIQAPEWSKKYLMVNQLNQAMLQIHTLAYFGNYWYSQISMPALTISMQQNGISGQWEGMTGFVSTTIKNNRFQQTEAEFNLGQLAILSKLPGVFVSRVTVQPVAIKSQYTREASLNLWNGNATLSIPAVLIQGNLGNADLEGLSIIQSSQTTSPNFYNSTVQIQINKLNVPNNVLGTISPATFLFSARNLNAKGMSDFFNTIQSVSSPGQLPALEPLALNMLTPSTTYDVTLDIQTASGNWFSRGDASLLPNAALTDSLTTLMSNIYLQGNFKISTLLIDKLITAYAKHQTAAMQAQSVTAATQNNIAAQNAAFNQLLINYMQEGKISVDTSIQVMGIRDQHLPVTQFNAKLDELSLPKDVSLTINNRYQELQKQIQAQAALPTPAAAQKALVEHINQTLHSWIMQGYIIQQNDTYLITLTYKNGVFLINGKMPLPGMFSDPFTVPAQQPPVLPVNPSIKSLPTTGTGVSRTSSS